VIARRAAKQALTQLEAGPAPAGRMPVVLGNEAGGVLVHEACGHGLEADAVLRGGSVYAGRVCERVGSAIVNVIDDGLLPGGWGSSRFDDEAEATGRTVLVEGGVLAGFLSDRASAAALAVSATGNGRRASFRHLPLPRMTNTYIDNGEATPEEIIGNTRYGLYAPSLSGGQVDPTSGSFLFVAREAYLIREGRIDRPVWGATIAGSALDVLADIDMVGNDLRVGAGNCAREGQRVFVGIGQPTVRIARMVVGGTDRRAAHPDIHETG
jgi:TldD protein